MSERPEVEIARREGLPSARPLEDRLYEWVAGNYVPEQPADRHWEPPPPPLSLVDRKKWRRPPPVYIDVEQYGSEAHFRRWRGRLVEALIQQLKAKGLLGR